MFSPDTEEELELVRAALAGGPADFEPIVRRFSLRVYAMTYSVLGERTAAEDAAQETFLRAFRKRGRVRQPEQFAAWIMAIARNQALDRLRRRREVALDDETKDLLPDDAALSPDAQLDTAEHHARIRAVLATLPERHRLALTLRYLEGHDCRTIESAMALSNGALRGILGRALAGMRAGLRLPLQKAVS